MRQKKHLSLSLSLSRQVDMHHRAIGMGSIAQAMARATRVYRPVSYMMFRVSIHKYTGLNLSGILDVLWMETENNLDRWIV